MNNNRLKDAFYQIQASDKLKADTFEHIRNRLEYRASRKQWISFKQMVAVCCLFIFIVSGFFGYGIYFAEASAISIDTNSSIELGVNCFGRVVTATAFDDAGNVILSGLSLRHKNYKRAVEKILASENIKNSIDEEFVVSITLNSENDSISEKMLNNLKLCVNESISYDSEIQADFSRGSEKLRNEAHQYGVSLGKYRAILELMEVDPSAAMEEYKEKSMHEIKKHISSCCNEDDIEYSNETKTKHQENEKENNNGAGNHRGRKIKK